MAFRAERVTLHTIHWGKIFHASSYRHPYVIQLPLYASPSLPQSSGADWMFSGSSSGCSHDWQYITAEPLEAFRCKIFPLFYSISNTFTVFSENTTFLPLPPDIKGGGAASGPLGTGL